MLPMQNTESLVPNILRGDDCIVVSVTGETPQCGPMKCKTLYINPLPVQKMVDIGYVLSNHIYQGR